MKALRRLMESRITGYGCRVFRVIDIIVDSISRDTMEYIISGLRRISKVIVAGAFTKYGWLLAIYGCMGKTYDSMIIVYYNSRDPRWTASYIIHELAHKGLGIECRSLQDIIVDETLAYLASFKSGFMELYEPFTSMFIKYASRGVIPVDNEYDLAYIAVPRIIAGRLTKHEYGYVVNESIKGLGRLIEIWLETRPSDAEVSSLAHALNALGLDPMKYDINYGEAPTGFMDMDSEEPPYRDYVIEGADEGYITMLRVLERVAREPSRFREIMAQWWDEVKEIIDDLEAYVLLHGGSRLRT